MRKRAEREKLRVMNTSMAVKEATMTKDMEAEVAKVEDQETRQSSIKSRDNQFMKRTHHSHNSTSLREEEKAEEKLEVDKKPKVRMNSRPLVQTLDARVTRQVVDVLIQTKPILNSKIQLQLNLRKWKTTLWERNSLRISIFSQTSWIIMVRILRLTPVLSQRSTCSSTESFWVPIERA